MEECYNCGFWNSDYEDCTCPHYDKWYACPIESKKPENKKEIEEYVKWLGEKEKEEMLSRQKDLNNVRQELLSRPDQYIKFKDLVERFDKVSAEYADNNWNLLQIYSNFNILIGELTNKTPEQESVLDKIRTEIQALPKTYPFVNHIDMYVKEDDVKKIIDKYTVEREGANEII